MLTSLHTSSKAVNAASVLLPQRLLISDLTFEAWGPHTVGRSAGASSVLILVSEAQRVQRRRATYFTAASKQAGGTATTSCAETVNRARNRVDFAVNILLDLWERCGFVAWRWGGR